MVDPSDLAHLLRRTEFVVRPDRVAALSGGTLSQAVDDIIEFAPNGGPQLPAYLTTNDAASGWNQYVYSVNWWFNRMTTAPRPFQEKMALFWHGHFTSSWWDIDQGFQMMLQNQLYREQALGNFVTLTQQMALQPAMLVYLSNADNVKGQPNQNFARELMELFTLGVGNYTEDDVNTSATAWTGHNYNRTSHLYGYVSAKHDPSVNTFFGVAKAWTGPDIITEILTGSKQPIAAAFIVKKLWEFLGYVGPAQNIIDDLASTFIASGMDLKVLLRALLNRPEFYTPTAKQGLVRSPIEFVAALSYYTGIAAGDLGAAWRLEATGQQMFGPPNVSGWKSNGYWLNTSALSARADFADNVGWKLAEGTTYDSLAVRLSKDPATAATQAAAAVDAAAAVFGLDLTPSSRQALINFRMSETNGYWVKRNLLLMTILTPEFNMA